MNARIEEARRLLRLAQEDYAKRLRPIDAVLRTAVAQDPDTLVEAHEVQASYRDLAPSFRHAYLAPLVQPPGPVQPAAALDPATGAPVAPDGFGDAAAPQGAPAPDLQTIASENVGELDPGVLLGDTAGDA